MCDVMPTISEDSISQRSSQFSGEDANFEQLMVSMLDERDKLMDSLRETQERLGETEVKLSEVEKERDSLQRQIAANLPQVRSLVTLPAFVNGMRAPRRSSAPRLYLLCAPTNVGYGFLVHCQTTYVFRLLLIIIDEFPQKMTVMNEFLVFIKILGIGVDFIHNPALKTKSQ